MASNPPEGEKKKRRGGGSTTKKKAPRVSRSAADISVDDDNDEVVPMSSSVGGWGESRRMTRSATRRGASRPSYVGGWEEDYDSLKELPVTPVKKTRRGGSGRGRGGKKTTTPKKVKKQPEEVVEEKEGDVKEELKEKLRSLGVPEIRFVFSLFSFLLLFLPLTSNDQKNTHITAKRNCFWKTKLAKEPSESSTKPPGEEPRSL